MAALHTDMTRTATALDQLQQGQESHADLLAGYTAQVTNPGCIVVLLFLKYVRKDGMQS